MTINGELAHQVTALRTMPVRSFALPLVTKFRNITIREGILFARPAGWAEFSPFPDYQPSEAARWLLGALEQAYRPWPTPVRTAVPVNCLIPAVSPAKAAELALSSGCRTAKVKVAAPGDTEADDCDRVAAVRDALGQSGKIRVDANGAWDVQQARRMIQRLNKYTVEYVEQPCTTIEELKQLRKYIDIPIAADESVRRVEDPLRVARAQAADILVLKVQPLGGVWKALEIAQECGLPVVVSSALETSIGLSAGVALAAALPELPYACGLATASLLAADPVHDPLLPKEGLIPVRQCTVDEELLEQYSASSKRTEWWQNYLKATIDVLSGVISEGTVR